MADSEITIVQVDPNAGAATTATGDQIAATTTQTQVANGGGRLAVANQFNPSTVNTTQTTLATQVKGPIPITSEATQAFPNDFYRYGYAAPDSNGLLLPPRSLLEQDEALVSIRLISLPSSNTAANTTTGAGTASSFTGNSGAPSDLATPFTHYFLESVSEPHQERMAILETFTSSWIYFFGEQTPIFNYSGFLLNSKNHRWVNDWISIYDRAFRGTQAVQRNAIIQMAYDGRIIEGYICAHNLSRTAIQDKGYPFSFSMVITNIYITSFSVDFAPASNAITQSISTYSQVFPPNNGTTPGLTSPGVNVPGLSVASAQTALIGGPTTSTLTPLQSIQNGIA